MCKNITIDGCTTEFITLIIQAFSSLLPTNALLYSVPFSGLEKRWVLTFSKAAFDSIWAQFWLGDATGMDQVETMNDSRHCAMNRTAP